MFYVIYLILGEKLEALDNRIQEQEPDLSRDVSKHGSRMERTPSKGLSPLPGTSKGLSPVTPLPGNLPSSTPYGPDVPVIRVGDETVENEAAVTVVEVSPDVRIAASVPRSVLQVVPEEGVDPSTVHIVGGHRVGPSSDEDGPVERLPGITALPVQRSVSDVDSDRECPAGTDFLTLALSIVAAG